MYGPRILQNNDVFYRIFFVFNLSSSIDCLDALCVLFFVLSFHSSTSSLMVGRERLDGLRQYALSFDLSPLPRVRLTVGSNRHVYFPGGQGEINHHHHHHHHHQVNPSNRILIVFGIRRVSEI